jgi:hypothetical protein
MNRYILNSAVVTSPGDYRYTLLTVEEAREWLQRGPYQSTVTYEETAQLASAMLGATITPKRITVRMKPGDEALVVRISLPEGSPRIRLEEKGRLGERLRCHKIELGVLVRKE